MKQRDYALATLEFLKTEPSLDIVLTTDEYNALYEKSDVWGTGPRYVVANQHSMDKLSIRKLIREAEIEHKDIFRDQLTQTLRTIGTHRFIVEILEADNLDSDLVVYSKARLNKVMNKLEEWATGTEKVPAPASKPAIKSLVSAAHIVNHPLETVSAMREMRHLVDTAKISVFAFNEEKIKRSATSPHGTIDYKIVSAQLRHNYTNYDVLRISRKIRRNTYWKLTAQPAIRIAVCEKLILMTEDPALHFRLMQEIEFTNAEFQKKLTEVAKAPNFNTAIDDLFIRTAKRKVFKKEKCNFMLCLRSL